MQDPKYFEEFEEEIRDLFGSGNGSEPYVAVHLRREANLLNPNEPEYSKNPFYVDLSITDYYEKAMALFPKEKFLVFSDDIEFAKNYFIGDEYEFDETKDPIEALTRMSNCLGVIMGNSSFSFWGGFLCKYQDKIVAPSAKNWFTDGVQRVGYPQNWTII